MKSILSLLLISITTLFLALSLPSQGNAQDADGDGHAAVSAGGDDCDDSDSNRFPGNIEVADRDNHDEDCDPTTFAGSNDDRDNDGFLPSWACNEEADGTLNCGRDCDDGDLTVNPHQMDICNRRDDNCDGNIDEDQPCQMLQKWSEEAKADAEQARQERRINKMTEKANPQEQVNNPAIQQAVKNKGTILQQNETNANDNTCFDAVQGNIAWDQNGVNKQWSPANINKLCEGAETSEQPALCFQNVLHGNIATGKGLTNWNWGQAIALCSGTTKAETTISCYESEIAKGRTHQKAVNTCRE